MNDLYFDENEEIRKENEELKKQLEESNKEIEELKENSINFEDFIDTLNNNRNLIDAKYLIEYLSDRGLLTEELEQYIDLFQRGYEKESIGYYYSH